MILTTNRHVTFDSAFYSRIHLTLQYQPLDHEARSQVWKTFLGLSAFFDEDYQRLGKYDLNGRRIKHLAKMAQLLAQSESEEVNMEHLDDVLSVALEGAQITAGE